jgi:hypothetical protein
VIPTISELWGGKLTQVKFDPVDHHCDLRVMVLDWGATHTYEIECHSVTDLHFRSTIPEPWSYAEVTEAELDTDRPSGQQILRLMLWSEDAELTVRCTSVEIHMAN